MKHNSSALSKTIFSKIIIKPTDDLLCVIYMFLLQKVSDMRSKLYAIGNTCK